MAPPQPLDIDEHYLRMAFDGGTVSRGVAYAGEKRVHCMEWSADGRQLTGKCVGSRGMVYDVEVYFSAYRGESEVGDSWCTCPVGGDCKHAVALLLTASMASRRGRAPAAEPWRRLLGEFVHDDSAIRSPGDAPLGIQVEMPGSDARNLASPTLRLVTPGKRGTWVRTGVTWDSIERSPHMPWGSNVSDRPLEDFVPEHLRRVRAIGRAIRAINPYTRDAVLNLNDAPADIWELLAAAIDVGVPLIAHTRTTHTKSVTLIKGSSAQLRVIRDDEGVAVAPNLAIDGHDWDGSPAGLLGEPDPHGLVVRSGDTLLIGPFAAPTSMDAFRQLFSRGSVRIPDDEVEEFSTDVLPRLAVSIAVEVADEALVATAVTGPRLQVTLSPDMSGAQVTWQVIYEVNGRSLAFGGDHRSALRDLDAEQQAWTAIRPQLAQAAALSLDWRMQTIRRGAVADKRGDLIGLMRTSTDEMINNADVAALTRSVRYTRLEAAMLHVEVLPQLQDLGVEVIFDGEVLDYREAVSPPRISIGSNDFGDADWFGLTIDIDIDGVDVPLADLVRELSTGATHMLLPNGTYFALDAPELQRLGELVEEAKALGELDNGKVRQRSYNATLWDELMELGVVDKELAVWRARMKRLAAARPPEPRAIPKGFAAELRDYQAEGLNWLNFLWVNRIGGILADDMGLGKTVQTLAMIAAALEEEPDGRFLVVAPTSVIANWAAEAARFTPDLEALTVTATSARVGVPLAEQIDGRQIVITSYALMRIGFEEFDETDWTGVIFDEAQFVKNHNSKGHQCARRLRADFKLAITGTPMENNLMELWSLLSLTAPGLFSSPKTFTEYFCRPIESGEEPERLALLRRRIRPVMLRRTKEQVAADLPAKQEQLLSINLNTKHDKIYQTRLTRERQKVLGLLGDFDENRFAILRSLTMLRQLSLHAGLVEDQHAEIASAKIDYLAEQLPDLIAEGHSALVFSQFTGFLRLIEERLVGMGIDVSYLDGSMSATQRGKEIKRFTGGKTRVFLISLKAGGFGLNLTEADYCFVCDPWWNPATEAQAVDRAHRIGQTRPVNVYRLVSAGTIEEKVVALQERKRELFTAVVDDGDLFGSAIGADDIRELIGGK
ncbi:helicase [Gordonia oryzae]|uniref:Helicase n=1 Tax=Gordonia oryzae TaxID=2487349 RepID=A0A3N4G9D7_9ACTN|nr:DEAD/DEAH box helicase [Gordonia oryzae]RPA59379.1 helicase [Gordonia oryzae]